MTSLLLLLIITIASSSTSSFATAVVVPLTPNIGTKIHSLYISPVTYNHTLIGPFNTYSNTEVGYYYIAQWDNPSPFVDAGIITPPNADCAFSSSSSSTSQFPSLQSYTPLWSVQTDNMRVCALKNHENPEGLLQVQLAQSGGNDLECGKEFDLFLAPMI